MSLPLVVLELIQSGKYSASTGALHPLSRGPSRPSHAELPNVGATLVVARLFPFSRSAPRRGHPQGAPLQCHMEYRCDSGTLTCRSPLIRYRRIVLMESLACAATREGGSQVSGGMPSQSDSSRRPARVSVVAMSRRLLILPPMHPVRAEPPNRASSARPPRWSCDSGCISAARKSPSARSTRRMPARPRTHAPAPSD